MRSFPPIREDYRRFDTFAQSFKTREQAENYIKGRNMGDTQGEVTPTQRELLNYSWGESRFSVDRRGQLHKQSTGGPHPGRFIAFSEDEKDPEFQRLTKSMIEKDKEAEARRKERTKK